MASSRPIASKPVPIQADGSSQQGPSRRSSGASSRTGKTRARDASRGSQASSRGRKPYEVSEEVDRGLVKIIDGTDVPFDTLSQAFEDVGGPRKLWLRKRFEQIAGTKSFGFLRLRNHRPSSEDRRQRQMMAKELADQWFPMHDDQCPTEAQYAYVARPVSYADAGIMRSHQRPNERFSTFSADGAVQNGNAATYRNTRGYNSVIASPVKRTFGEGQADAPKDYVARANRARSLSISSITRRLESLTGNTGLYEHIRRGSIKSHISPLFRSVRWSRGSRVTSGRMSYPERPNEQLSPNAQVRYIADPDFEIHYHKPSMELLNRADSNDMAAVLILLQAQIIGISDEEACNRLTRQLPDNDDDRKTYVNVADANGVTALHLAVAYGFPQTCVLLMQNGANPRAVTHHGSSICRFAKPAQDLTNGDVPLFKRIYNSRQWVCAGLPPRLSPDNSQRPILDPGDRSSYAFKRQRTNEPLPPLDEIMDEQPELTNVPDQVADIRQSTASNLPPIVTDFNFQRSSLAASHHNSVDQQHLIFGYDVSPTALEHCAGGHDAAGYIMTPDSDPRSAWSSDSISPMATMKFPSQPYTSISMQRTPGNFVGHAQSGQSFLNEGLQIENSGIQQPQSAVLTSWPEVYSMAPNMIPTTATQVTSIPLPNNNSSETEAPYLNTLPTSMGAFISNDFPPFPQYPAMDHYQHYTSGQQRHYSPRPPQPFYPTPPDNSNWPTDPLPGQQWPDFEDYYGGALAEQDFYTLSQDLRNAQHGQQHTSTPLYFDDASMMR